MASASVIPALVRAAISDVDLTHVFGAASARACPLVNKPDIEPISPK
jgi:hypothetical protein